MGIKKKLSNQKTSQTTRSQPSNQHQTHKPTSGLPLALINPHPSAHHTATRQKAIRGAEQQLHDNEVEGVAVEDGALAVDVAEEVEGEEEDAGEGEGEERAGAVREGGE